MRSGLSAIAATEGLATGDAKSAWNEAKGKAHESYGEAKGRAREATN